jgi:hypothetical protein
MPTRKQRRREQKSRRHQYEYVYVDEEGNEVAVDPAELHADKSEPREPRPRGQSRSTPATQSASRRTVQPPSWRRSARRALLLGPLFVVAMMLFNRKLSLGQQIAPAVFLIAFFIPFSYFTDSLAHRMYRKRLDRSGAAKSR